MQNSDFRTRISSLYGSQTSPMVFSFKTMWLTSELLVSMGPRPHLCFFAFKTATLAPEFQISIGPSPHLWFCAFTTATLRPELIVSTGHRYHLSPDTQNSVISTRIISLHVSQTLPVFLCMPNNVISIRITSLYGCQPSSVVFAGKRATFGSELKVSMVSQTSPRVFRKQNIVNFI